MYKNSYVNVYEYKYLATAVDTNYEVLTLLCR